MIKGIEIFKEYFADYKEQYVLIGGAACDMILNDTDVAFRATKDLDLVLIVETLTLEFGQKFWQFIQDGKYQNKSKSSGKPQFYRFDKPENLAYPYMLELFSRTEYILGDEDSVLTPMHISDEVPSLSAILLNDAYYRILLAGKTEVNDIIILSPEYIIPFKAKAWLDLSEKKKNGIHVDDKDIKKHKNDIVRLLSILIGNESCDLPEEVKIDMERFISKYIEEPVEPKTLKITGVTVDDIIAMLKQVYF